MEPKTKEELKEELQLYEQYRVGMERGCGYLFTDINSRRRYRSYLDKIEELNRVIRTLD